MRPKISSYIATSINGYIAKKDHTLDWLEPSIHLQIIKTKIMVTKNLYQVLIHWSWEKTLIRLHQV